MGDVKQGGEMRLVLKVKVELSGLPIVKCCNELKSWKEERGDTERQQSPA
jgi:hypothetical protein